MTLIWAVGDAATGGTDAAKVASLIKAGHPDGFLWLGDVYESGTEDEFGANYKPSWGAMDSVCYPIPGNHDWGNYQAGYLPYFKEAGRPSDPFYSFPLGGWQFIMLNSEGDVAEQVAWAAQHIGPDRKNIACWHRPRYCSGSHGDAMDMDPLWQLLGPHCAVILGGHAHNMQHFKPDSTGCIQLVSGAGGRSLYAEIADDPRLEWGKADGYGAVRLDLGDNSLGIQWITEDGQAVYHSEVPVG